MEEDLDYLLKIVVIGDSGVGKTNLIHRFNQGSANQLSRPTIGVEFSSKTVKVKDLNVKAQFWDTAGQEKYRSMTTSYYKGSSGGILVYDITQRCTFASVTSWLKDFRDFTDEKIAAILIGRRGLLREQEGPAGAATGDGGGGEEFGGVGRSVLHGDERRGVDGRQRGVGGVGVAGE